MRTSELIDYILDFTGNTVPRDKLLRWLNIAQNELLSLNSKASRVLPDEYITTVAGQQAYQMPLGTRSVSLVYARKDQFFPNRYYGNFSRGALEIGYLDDGTEIYEIPFTTNESNNPFAQDVSITFPETFDPGDTTDVFKVERYTWAEQLLSEQIPITIPESQQTKALMYRVLALMEEMEYGQPGAFADRYQREYEPEWIRFSNRPVVYEQTRTKPRSA